jgi:hypothetical protein
VEFLNTIKQIESPAYEGRTAPTVSSIAVHPRELRRKLNNTTASSKTPNTTRLPFMDALFLRKASITFGEEVEDGLRPKVGDTSAIAAGSADKENDIPFLFLRNGVPAGSGFGSVASKEDKYIYFNWKKREEETWVGGLV